MPSGRRGRGGLGREPGGTGTRPPGARFLLAAAFKEAPALRWTGGEGGARPPGSARRVALRSAPLAGAAGARRGCDAAVVFVGSRGRGAEVAGGPWSWGTPGRRRSPARPRSLPPLC